MLWGRAQTMRTETPTHSAAVRHCRTRGQPAVSAVPKASAHPRLRMRPSRDAHSFPNPNVPPQAQPALLHHPQATNHSPPPRTTQPHRPLLTRVVLTAVMLLPSPAPTSPSGAPPPWPPPAAAAAAADARAFSAGHSFTVVEEQPGSSTPTVISSCRR